MKLINNNIGRAGATTGIWLSVSLVGIFIPAHIWIAIMAAGVATVCVWEYA